MARRKTTDVRHTQVIESFDKLNDLKQLIAGVKVKKYHYNFCLHMTAQKHGYSVKFTERIINGWT